MLELRIWARERAEPRRADEQDDEDEADHRRDAEARESGDDDPRGPEHDQGVAEAGCFRFDGHETVLGSGAGIGYRLCQSKCLFGGGVGGRADWPSLRRPRAGGGHHRPCAMSTAAPAFAGWTEIAARPLPPSRIFPAALSSGVRPGRAMV